LRTKRTWKTDGHNRDQITKDLGKLHNEKAHNLYSSLNGVIKSRRMGEMRNAHKTLLGNLGKESLERPKQRLQIFKWMLEEKGVKLWTGLNWHGIGSSGTHL
jgi:hypothetical protein